MRKEIKLYNIILPLWSFYVIPSLLWIIILPANFIIDSIVFLAALAVYKIPEKKIKYTKCILRIWAYGFLADIIGAGFLLLLLFLGYVSDIAYNPLSSPAAFAVTTIGVMLAGICIYLFNYKKVMPLIELDDNRRKKVSLIIAIFTTPYTMYIPSELFF